QSPPVIVQNRGPVRKLFLHASKRGTDPLIRPGRIKRPPRFILSPGQGFFRLRRRVRSPVSAAGKQQDDTENRQQARRPAADPSAGFRFLYSRAENLFFHSALLHIRYPFTAPPVTPST